MNQATIVLRVVKVDDVRDVHSHSMCGSEKMCMCVCESMRALKYKVSLLKSPRIIFVAPKAWCI